MDAHPVAAGPVVADHLRHQSLACRELGSPLYAGLLERMATEVDEDGWFAAVLGRARPDVLAEPGPAALGLRLLGAVHRLVLSGRAPALAAHYPSAGGRPGSDDAVWAAFRATVAEDVDTVLAGSEGPPQTNEVGRAAVLLGGLTVLAARTGLPLRLVELGASAGLNLRPDLVDCAGRGPGDSPVDLGADAWTGAVVPGATPAVVERVGGDVAPLDPTDPEDARTLRCFLWPDQVHRRARLDGAIALAERVRVPVARVGAGELVAGLSPAPGTVTVVWHSVVRQYLPVAERAAVTEGLDRLGAAAGREAPVAHLAFEPRRVQGVLRFLVTLRVWPGADEQVLGVAPPHGLPVTWSPAVRERLRR